MKKKTMNFQLRLTNLQYEFLRTRADDLNLNVSKMISIFLNDQKILVPDRDEIYKITHSFVPLYNNVHQLIRASRFVSFRVDDRSIHERFIQIAETLEDDIERNSIVKSMVVRKVNEFITDTSLKDSNDFIYAHSKNLKLNIKFLILDDSDFFDRRLAIRMTEDERKIIENKSKLLGTTMKNVMLAHVMSANVFSLSSVSCTNMSELREYGQLLNSISRFMNESLKAKKTIEDVDMLSMITDLNEIDDYIRSDTDCYEEIIYHLNSRIKIRLLNEGVYWTESFRKKVRDRQYGRE